MNRGTTAAALVALFALTAVAGPRASGENEQGSLLVRLISGEDQLAIAAATVEAIDAASIRRDRREPPSRPVILRRALSDEKGWVKLAPLPPGDIVLRILPKGREHAHISEPITIRDGIEEVLDEIEVPPAGSVVLHLELSDSVHKRIREELVETIRIQGSTDDGTHINLARETTENEVIFEEVPPGKWKFLAFLEIDSTETIVDTNGVALHVPEGTRIDASLRIPSLIFRGRVTLRDEPVIGDAAELLVRPVRGGRRDVAISVPLDSDGQFSLPLRRPGKHDLKIYVGTSLIGEIPFFEFLEHDADTLIEIRLPEGRIEGIVIDADGRPVAGAPVNGSTRPGKRGRPVTATANTGSDGRFALDGLIGGLWKIVAENQNAESDKLLIDLGEKATRDGIVLQLSNTKAKLLVLDAGGLGSPGLKVMAAFHRADGRVVRDSGFTDENGILGIRLNAESGSPVAVTVANGNDLAVPFLLPFSNEMSVRLSGHFGSVTLSRQPKEGTFLISESGTFLELKEIWPRSVRSRDPASISIPAGGWLLVEEASPLERDQIFRGLGPSIRGARRIELTEGGSLELMFTK